MMIVMRFLSLFHEETGPSQRGDDQGRVDIAPLISRNTSWRISFLFP